MEKVVTIPRKASTDPKKAGKHKTLSFILGGKEEAIQKAEAFLMKWAAKQVIPDSDKKKAIPMMAEALKKHGRKRGGFKIEMRPLA